MKNLVGRSFSLAEGRYRIVDVRRLSGDALVYAERVDVAIAGPVPPAPLAAHRTAFRYGDIAALLDAAPGL